VDALRGLLGRLRVATVAPCVDYRDNGAEAGGWGKFARCEDQDGVQGGAPSTIWVGISGHYGILDQVSSKCIKLLQQLVP
jgi:hypothetical protein